MWGYELALTLTASPTTIGLRIPMWGYELTNLDRGNTAIRVTNPHVGL